MNRHARAVTLPLWAHLAILVAITVLPAACFSAILAYERATAAQHQLEQQAEALTERLTERLDRFLGGTEGAIQALATTADLDNLAELDRRARTLLPERGTAVSMRDRSGQQIINTAVPFGTPLPRTQSEVVRASDQEVFTTGKVHYSRVYTGTVSPRWFFIVNAPVRQQGDVAYAINIAIAADELQSIMFQGLPQGWLATVLDQGGRIVARSVAHQEYVGRRASERFLEALGKASRGGTRSTTLDGIPVYASYNRSPRTGYAVVTSVPLQLLHAPISRLWQEVAILAALAIASTAIASLLYSRLLLKPIRAIEANSHRLQHDQRMTPVTSPVVEFNKLNESLHLASARLLERNEELRGLLLELNHRVKNTLASLQSVVDGTIRSQGGKEHLRSAVRGRIAALSAAQDLLTNADWREVDLAEVLQATVATARCEVEIQAGPKVMLSQKAVVALCQSSHEVYDYLCSADSIVIVSWSVAEGRLSISFQVHVHHRDSNFDRFGMKVVQASIDRQLEGSVQEISSARSHSIIFRFPCDGKLGKHARLENAAASQAENAPGAPVRSAPR